MTSPIKYNDNEINKYFVGKVTILEIVKEYEYANKEYKFVNKEYYKYKTTKDSFIPYIQSSSLLEPGNSYEIKGYKYEDEIRIVDIKKLK